MTSQLTGGTLEPIVVRSYGNDGPEVWVVHGGPAAQGSVRDLAQDLGRRFSAKEPLQRRSGVVPLTVDRHVQDMADVMPQQSLLVGWSWGAMLSLSFAALHPSRVSKLALVGCGTYDAHSRRQYQSAMAERLTATAREQIASLQGQLTREPDRSERDRIFAEIGHLAGVAQAHDPFEIEDAPVIVDADGFGETWNDVLMLQGTRVEPDRFSSVECPVLMIHGAQDPHPGRATFNRLSSHIQQLDYLMIERCGHTPWRERQGRTPFIEALTEWLA